MRIKMTDQKKVFDAKLDFLNKKVQTQQVQIAQLSKTGKRTSAKESVKEREKDNNSSPNNSDSPNTN